MELILNEDSKAWLTQIKDVGGFDTGPIMAGSSAASRRAVAASAEAEVEQEAA